MSESSKTNDKDKENSLETKPEQEQGKGVTKPSSNASESMIDDITKNVLGKAFILPGAPPSARKKK